MRAALAAAPAANSGALLGNNADFASAVTFGARFRARFLRPFSGLAPLVYAP